MATKKSPNDIVNIALIGAGGQGITDISRFFPEEDVRVIAVADPAGRYQDDFFYKKPCGRLAAIDLINKHYQEKDPSYSCRGYEDFRVMLDKEKDLDGVVVATPDHLHAYVSVYCMRRGLHVLCEKPLCHNIREVRWMAKVAKETGVVTQMGNPGHARDALRENVELIQSGTIGTVTEAHAWVRAARWHKWMTATPTDEPPVPEDLNWDLWLGPRPARPYHGVYHPVRWRDFWTFGLGAIGDFVCHDMDALCWALNLERPTWVEACQAGKTSPELTPHGEIVTYFFKGDYNHPDLKVTWWDGCLRPPTPLEWTEGLEWPVRGSMFVGDKGILLNDGLYTKSPILLPEHFDKATKRPEPWLRRVPSYTREWIDGIKGGPAPGSEFGYASRLTELALLGVLALRTGKRITWDYDNMKAIGCPEADELINGEPYREGWQID